MKLPLLFYFIVYWLVAIVLNLVFKSLFGFINYHETYGFITILVFSFDFITVFLLRKKFGTSLLMSIILFLSIISVFIFMLFVWNKGERESVLAQFLFMFVSLVTLLFLLKIFWNKYKFEYSNHLLIILIYTIITSALYFGLFLIFSAGNLKKPSLKYVFIKQMAFIVPYPFIYKLSEMIMKFLEDNFTTPTERIVIDLENKEKKNGQKNGGA